MDRKLTQRGEERRRQLMAYATARFAQNGFHPTSVAEITEGLGVGKGVFYWYFDSKEELLRAILADAQLDLRRRQRAAVSGAGSPSDGIERGIRASMEWSIQHPDYFRLFQFAATDDRFNDGLRKGEGVAVNDAAKVLAAAMKAGEIADGDATLLSHALLGVHTHLVHLVHRGVLEPTEAVIDAAVDFCLHGLLDRSAP
ncbi:TetR/AcrR family transcriptional regulator [Aquihabitans daechungensis]|uniref:TetR/AcrR family transcriptional regulator n=1 Tax=Aquihabitans daechungensis TaxID=1052257 RepID=UPI003BA0CB97